MEGIPNLWGERHDFSQLPIWRKIISTGAAVGAAVVWVTLDTLLPSKRIRIYSDAPTAPVTATKQVYPVRVEGGYLRYVTNEQTGGTALLGAHDEGEHPRVVRDGSAGAVDLSEFRWKAAQKGMINSKIVLPAELGDFELARNRGLS